MIRILIIDEVPLVCDIFKVVLDDEPDLDVVGIATTIDDAVAYAKQADIVILSTSMPDNVAFKIIKTLRQDFEAIKIIAIGLADYEDEIINYVEAGVVNYVLREDSTEALLETIRNTHNGKAEVSPQIAARLMKRLANLRERCPDEDEYIASFSLTSRESEILELLRKNNSNQTIAETLHIELGTVKNHVHNILKKLNVNSRKDIPKRLRI